ncbi:DNA damage-induced apoptosis suppressor protein isoform X2 [Xiphophorus maculatus]|uniref:DNA damage-induced apoptosis suppressor protein isoform X2 n=1 Tax=Xiphophorus maculatus TaxID=8083 RepID=UPI000C6CC187|nr:DNA damage-induced apoptosis suppressor protein isoform X2 [Xiphophorus maculatus]
MSIRRVLVGCTVLSLQDACVFYPCCKGCFSRIDAEQRDTLRCSRCDYRCLKDQVEYRYRLSLRVVRNTSTFSVTVFGNSLNSFFGIHASGLQRLAENSEGPIGPSARPTLLAKAVEDCFLGRYFIFGIKVSGREPEPWLEEPDGSESGRGGRAQFVASQMILPPATGLTGCTVLSYYQRLLQRASEYVAESADPGRPSAAPLLMISGRSPSSTLSDVSLYPSGHLSQALLRFQHQNQSFTSTPPWQQSLGLVTSSAEQEERSSQDGADHSSRLTGCSAMPLPVQRVHTQNHPGTEERPAPLKLESSFHSHPSFTGDSNSSCTGSVGNSFSVKTCCSPSQPRYKSCSFTPKELPITHQSQTFLSSSFAWDDLPFSESLSEFLCKQDKDLNVLGKTTNFNLQHEKQTETFAEIANRSAEPASACLNAAGIISTDHLQDITNTPTVEGEGKHILSDRNWKNCGERMSRPEDNMIPRYGEGFLSFEKQEELNEVDGYNCSADLFSDSFVHPATYTTQTHTERSPSDACFRFAEMNVQHVKNEASSVSHSTPDKRELKSNLCTKRDFTDLQDFDFVPPSQSTPIVKVGGMTRSPAVTSCRSLKDETSKENLRWSIRSRRRKNKITPGRRFRKDEKCKERHPVGQQVARQRGATSFESSSPTSQKHDSEASNVTFCDYDNADGVVPPIPAHKMLLSVFFREKWQTENGHRDSGCNRRRSPGDGGNDSRDLWDQTQTVFHANETEGERDLDGSKDHLTEPGSLACDWSRDLFSDSYLIS